MIKEGIDRIVDLAAARLLEVDGRTYSDKGLKAVAPPEPLALHLHSLTGVALYLTENRDALALDHLSVIVVSHQKLLVVGPLVEPWKDRALFLQADFEDAARFHYDVYQPQEDFVVGCQTAFTPTEELSALLRLAGNLKQEGSVQTEDNGVSQRTTARTGVALVEEVSVKPRWELCPYVTWPELEQPSQEFILRVRRGKDGAELALFLVDDSRWKVTARSKAVAWLKERVPQAVVVLG